MKKLYLIEQLEKQRKFDKEPYTPKVIEEYKCIACKQITMNICITKAVFDEETYERINELQKIVDEHNKDADKHYKNIKPKTFLQKLTSHSSDSLDYVKWIVVCDVPDVNLYIADSNKIHISVKNTPSVHTVGFRKYHVICPKCNFKYYINMYDS